MILKSLFSQCFMSLFLILIKSYNLLPFFPSYFDHWTLIILFLSEYNNVYSYFGILLNTLNEFLLKQFYLHSSSLIKKFPIIITELVIHFGKKIIDFFTKLIEFIIFIFYNTTDHIIKYFYSFYLNYSRNLFSTLKKCAFQVIKLLFSFIFNLFLLICIKLIFLYRKVKEKVISDIYNCTFLKNHVEIKVIKQVRILCIII